MRFSRLRRYLFSPPVLVGLLSPPLLVLYWIACAAEIQSNYLAPPYTFGMGIWNAVDVGITHLFARGDGVWFLPTAALVSVAYIGLSLGRRELRRACLVAALLLPFPLWGPAAVAAFVVA